MYSCPSCGGNVKYDILGRKLRCFFCDNLYDPDTFDVGEKKDYIETKIVTCPQCAAELICDDNEAAVFCSFCGASNVLESRMSRQGMPDRIIPFMKTKADCKKAYKKFVSRNIYAPTYLKKDSYTNSFRGIYMPYWYYTVEKNEKITLSGGKNYQKGDYFIKNLYRLEANVEAEFNGLTHDASSTFADYLSEEIAPFDEEGMVDFSPVYISGFYADLFDVNKTAYDGPAIEPAYKKTRNKLYKVKVFRRQNVNKSGNDAIIKAFFEQKDVSGYKVMFPVWFTSHRVKDRIFYSVVNGQTGKVYGDVPVSPLKFILFSFIGAIPIWVILSLFGYIAPLTCLFLACVMIFGIAGLYLMNVKKLDLKESMGDDLGYLDSKEDTKNDSVFAEMDKYEKEYVVKKKIKSNKKKLPYMAVVWGVIMVVLASIVIYTAAGGLDAYSNQAVAQTGSILVLGMGVVTAINAIGVKSKATTKYGKVRPGMIISLVGLIIGAVCLFVNPTDQAIYYWATIIVTVCSFGTIFDIIFAHNILCSNPLPQFKRKGGDDDDE